MELSNFLHKLAGVTHVRSHTRVLPTGRVSVVRTYEKDKKDREFAPGIPEKGRIVKIPTVKSQTTWDFGVHSHQALRAGQHYDLRLADPDGNAHSWATRYWPHPGESVVVNQQSTHSAEYLHWAGTIKSGYGAGKVDLHMQGKALIHSADDSGIRFTLLRGKHTEDMALLREAGKKWRLINFTPTAQRSQIPQDKPSYKEISFDKIPVDNNLIASLKLDGAHSVILIEGGKRPRVFSYRKPKQSEHGLIEYTHKISGLFDTKAPSSYGRTLLRGETVAIDKNGKALPAEVTSGMLNATVENALQIQTEKGKLHTYIFDVAEYKGRDYRNNGYSDKLGVLKQVEKDFPGIFTLPPMAEEKVDKEKLIAAVRNKVHPLSEEGVVLWNKQGGPPIKAKIRPTQDVFVRGFFSGEGKYKGRAVGGFYYSRTRNGPIIGRVGTGLSDSLREEMKTNPRKFLGKAVEVTSQGEFPKTKALRAPSFERMRIDESA